MTPSDKQELQTKGLFPMDDEMTSPKPYREWWIDTSTAEDEITPINSHAEIGKFHVVEASALKAALDEMDSAAKQIIALKKELEELKEVLPRMADSIPWANAESRRTLQEKLKNISLEKTAAIMESNELLKRLTSSTALLDKAESALEKLFTEGVFMDVIEGTRFIQQALEEIKRGRGE